MSISKGTVTREQGQGNQSHITQCDVDFFFKLNLHALPWKGVCEEKKSEWLNTMVSMTHFSGGKSV